MRLAVDLLAGLLDDLVSLTPEAREPQEVARDGLRPFLRISRHSVPSTSVASTASPARLKVLSTFSWSRFAGHERKVLPDQGRFFRLQAIGGEDGEDEQVSARTRTRAISAIPASRPCTHSITSRHHTRSNEASGYGMSCIVPSTI